jgi:hypothetical protein
MSGIADARRFNQTNRSGLAARATARSTGSPTIISIMLPSYLTLGWIPQRQVGVQLFGSYTADRWELGYAATVANGQTDGLRDVGDTKGYGGRLYLRRQGELRLLLGASALYRPYRRDTAGYTFDASGALGYQITRTVENHQLTAGLDQSIDYAGLRIRQELVFYQTEYALGKRDTFMGAGLTPDTRQFNWSFLAAYRYGQLEPYFLVDYFYCSPAFGWDHVWQPGVGLNAYVSSNVMLKAAWVNVRFYQDNEAQDMKGRLNVNVFNGLLVWAF